MTKPVNCFRVLLNGKNFRMVTNGETRRLGFYATRFVEAVDRAHAEASAVELIRNDPTLRDAVVNPSDNPPLVLVTAIEDVESLQDAGGFTFYPEDDEGNAS